MKSYIPKLIGATINGLAYPFHSYSGKLAMQLFSKPRKGRLQALEIDFLKTAQQQRFRCEDLSINTYYWEGSGKTILLAHGWESNSYRWKDLVSRLQAKNYTIVALDAPAHGASTGKEFNAVLYSKCINEVAQHFKPDTIIGHSVGGMATIFTTKNHNIASLNKVILLGAPDKFSDILNQYETLMGFSKRVKTAIRAFILQKFNSSPEQFSTARFCNDLELKGLIIHDKKDRIIPFKDGTAIHKAFKNTTFIRTKGYGHGLKTDLVYEHILDFLSA
jgi:pimeloyl-ACP methyl ester carboxylesterase